MNNRLRPGAIAFCLLVMATAPGLAAEPPDAPALEVAGGDFPALLMRRAAQEGAGNTFVIACDHIRARRIDELDPLWEQSVDRIHLDCDEMTEAELGADTMVTLVTAYLKPGAVQFAGIPVAEVRLMDSDLWGDHQYLLDLPYPGASTILKQYLVSRCNAQQDNPSLLRRHGCALEEREDGLYLENGEAGGIWVHADREDPQRTVYAEAWAD